MGYDAALNGLFFFLTVEKVHRTWKSGEKTFSFNAASLWSIGDEATDAGIRLGIGGSLLCLQQGQALGQPLRCKMNIDTLLTEHLPR